MNVFKIYFVIAGLANIHSKTVNPSLSKDNHIKDEPKNTENFYFCSEGENSTFVHNSSIECPKKSKILFLYYCDISKINLLILERSFCL